MPRSRRYGSSSRACAKPMPPPSCSRYVARSAAKLILASEHDQRQRGERDVLTGADVDAPARGVRLVGAQLAHPAAPEAPGRQLELDVVVAAVEQQQERVVDHALAVLVRRGDLLAVEEHPDDVRALPVALGHPPPVGAEPPGVREAGALLLGAVEELAAAEHRMVAAQRDQAASELLQALPRLVDVPVVPRDLVVLAPGVVAAA